MTLFTAIFIMVFCVGFFLRAQWLMVSGPKNEVASRIYQMCVGSIFISWSGLFVFIACFMK